MKRMILLFAFVILVAGLSFGLQTLLFAPRGTPALQGNEPGTISPTAMTQVTITPGTPAEGLSAQAGAAVGQKVFMPMISSAKPTSPVGQPTAVGNGSAFAIGPGGADVIPHQIVRTADDHLFVFGYKGDGSALLNAYWTSAAGLPQGSSSFNGSQQVNNGANILSVEVVYDGAHTIHVLTNDQNGQIKDRPFDTNTHAFKAAKVLDSSGGTVVGYYAGTSGLSGMFDASGVMHLVYWTSSHHAVYRSYTYTAASDSLVAVEGPFQVDTDGSASHPVVAVSPLDGSVTVAWISESKKPARILVRSKSASGWASAQAVSTAAVWVSPNSGINIDQGPSLLISADGTKLLIYIEDYGPVGGGQYEYGKVHYVRSSGAGWSDQSTGFYSHDPALAVNGAGQIFVIGHGHPLNSGVTSMDDMYIYPRNTDGSWAAAKRIIAAPAGGGQSFDTSPSVKWSVVGFNRPEVVEFLFSMVVGGNYANSTLYYARYQ